MVANIGKVVFRSGVIVRDFALRNFVVGLNLVTFGVLLVAFLLRGLSCSENYVLLLVPKVVNRLAFFLHSFVVFAGRFCNVRNSRFHFFQLGG